MVARKEAREDSALPEFKMLKRTDLEKREYEILSPFASKAAESKGRVFDEEECDLRTAFQRDRDRIIHSKAFRRLMHKTQVFIAATKDHYRTRLTHTLEVNQVARTIARGLQLNEDLVEAIALGHDLGHTPFGHNGEYVLNRIHPGGFRHNEQSLRVVDLLEGSGDREGMNLTMEVRDGILNHSGKDIPFTPEGQIVRISDRIAYINHDIDDAIRSGVLTERDLPDGPIKIFGKRHSERINNMVLNVMKNSEGKNEISMDKEHETALLNLRDFMFEKVYNSPRVKGEEELLKVENTIKSLYDFFTDNPNMLPEDERSLVERDGINTVVKDYIAGMTDRYASQLYDEFIR